MIHNVFLMTRDGRLAFHRQYWSVDISAEERQEFLSTYKHFETELGSQVDLPIHVKNIKFIYTDAGTNLLLVFAVDMGDEDEKIKDTLKKARALLISKFGHEIDAYIQKPVPLGDGFKGFAAELDNVIVTMLKICLLGQGGVGKSTMLKLLTADSIPGDYYPTIAVDIETLQGVRFGPYELAVWDFAGQDRFRSLW
ncbi:MAG: ADP-ribosylation factor-like protein, partial [Promethearchaeota archaeon]